MRCLRGRRYAGACQGRVSLMMHQRRVLTRKSGNWPRSHSSSAFLIFFFTLLFSAPRPAPIPRTRPSFSRAGCSRCQDLQEEDFGEPLNALNPRNLQLINLADRDCACLRIATVISASVGFEELELNSFSGNRKHYFLRLS